MKKILVLEDSVDFAEEITQHLQICGYDCESCYDPLVAKKLYSQKKFDLIISDIEMPEQKGTDFFKSMRDEFKKNNTAFILMTGNLDVISIQNAYDMGVNECLLKPLNKDDLKIVVDLVLQQTNPQTPENIRFFKVALADYIQTASNSFDIYLQINDNFMCLAKKGQKLSTARLMNYHKKGLTEIYLTAVDFALYTDTACAALISPPEKSVDQLTKKNLHAQLLKLANEQTIGSFFESKLLKKSLLSLEIYSQTAFDNDEMFELMDQLSQNQRLFELAALRTLLTLAIATYWKWTHPKILSKITLASLFCGVGQISNSELYFKSRTQFTSADAKEYETYPQQSHNQLSKIQKIPEEVLLVALQHQENDAGLGFPAQLNKEKLHSYSRVIHAVAVLIQFLESATQKEEVRKSVDRLYSFQKKRISEQLLKSFYVLFSFEVPEELSSVLLPSETSR